MGADTAEAPVSASTSRWANRALGVVCVATIGFLMVQILCFGYGRDQGIYAMVARAVLRGEMPYRDAWDFKPPGIFLIYAVARAVFGTSQVGIRVIEVAGLAAMAVGMVRLAERWWGEPRIGLIAAALSVLVHAQLEFWHTAQPESFGGMITIGALLCASAARDDLQRRRRIGVWIASGALFGVAGLLKPPLVGGAGVVGLALAWAEWKDAPKRDGRAALRAAAIPIAAVGGGVLLPIAVCAAWFAARGAIADLYDVLVLFTPHYTALSWEGVTVGGMLYEGFTEWLTNYNSLVTAGLLLLLALRPSPRERAGVAVLLGVIVIHIVGVAMQGKFFPYHYGATWPLTAMLSALGIWKIWELAARRGTVGLALFAGLMIALATGRSATKDVRHSFLERCRQRVQLLARGGHDVAELDRLASVADVNAAANRGVAELLRARTPPDRPVFVWGFEPVIYDLAERAPASRFLYDVPQRVSWAKEGMRTLLMRDLAARSPSAIVVEHRDVFPMVTGDFLDSADTLVDFTELSALLESRFELVATIEDFDVYLTKGGR